MGHKGAETSTRHTPQVLLSPVICVGLAFPKGISLGIKLLIKPVCSTGKSDEWAEQSCFKGSCITLGKSKFLMKLWIWSLALLTSHFKPYVIIPDPFGIAAAFNVSGYIQTFFYNVEPASCHLKNQSLAITVELQEDCFRSHHYHGSNLVTKSQFSMAGSSLGVYSTTNTFFEL